MTSPNPSGLCLCGCGQPAPIATRSRTSAGHVKGQPMRFAKGHGPTVGGRTRTEKPCRGCGLVKPLDDFHQHATTVDGRQPYCKRCNYLQRQSWAEENRERHNENTRRNRLGKPQRQEADRAKYLARKRLQYALSRGYIQRPNECSHCGKRCKPHGHHHDYSKPLEVEWLCPLCHAHLHPRKRKHHAHSSR